MNNQESMINSLPVVGIPNSVSGNRDLMAIRTLIAHIEQTHKGHYANDVKMQARDVHEAIGIAKDFYIGSAMKYLWRSNKSKDARIDLLKAAHYCILAATLKE